MIIPLHQLPLARWRKIMREDKCALQHSRFTEQMAREWDNWKAIEALREKRQRWIYGFITATVLALVGFLVMGGCR